MRSVTIFIPILVLCALGQAMDPKVFATFMREVDAGKQQVLTGVHNLNADIKLHPDNRDQHKAYCGQLTTMLDNVRIKIKEFGKAYLGQMDSAQSSGWAHAGSTVDFMMTDMNQLCDSI